MTGCHAAALNLHWPVRFKWKKDFNHWFNGGTSLSLTRHSGHVFQTKLNSNKLSEVRLCRSKEKALLRKYPLVITQTLTHSQLSGNRQRVLIGLEEWSLWRDSTSLQGTRVADLIWENCAFIAGGYVLLLFSFNL